MSTPLTPFMALLEADELAPPNLGADLEVVATFAERQKSRHRTQTCCAKPLGWFLPRGLVLKEGDILLCKTGQRVKVKAAQEECSQVASTDALALMKVAYHLGNRHVPLQIAAGVLRYQKDHVLDDMVAGLGLEVIHILAPFDPEAGAYHGKANLLHGGHHH